MIASKNELTQAQLIQELIIIKRKSHNDLKQLRGSGSVFSEKGKTAGFYNTNNTAIEAHKPTIEYLEKQKAIVFLEEKRLAATVMIATLAGRTLIDSERSISYYHDYARFVNNLAVYDEEDRAAPEILKLLKDPDSSKLEPLFDEDGFIFDKQRQFLLSSLATSIHFVFTQNKNIHSEKLKKIQSLFGIEIVQLKTKTKTKPLPQNELSQLVSQKTCSAPYKYEPKVKELLSYFSKEQTPPLSSGITIYETSV